MSTWTRKSVKRKKTPDIEEVFKPRKAPNLVGPQTTVTVNVSSIDVETKPFQVHKNYICHYSPYFEAAFNGGFIEGETQVLDLDDTNPRVFGIFVNWLYTQTVVDEEGELPPCSDCINLWILADRLLVPSLQNHALAALDRARILYEGVEGRYCLTDAIFQRVWDHTGAPSFLRMYLVKVMVELPARSRIRHPERYPKEMLASIIHGMRRREERRIGRKPPGNPWEPFNQELKGYFVPEGVEGRKVVQAAPGPVVGNDSGFIDG